MPNDRVARTLYGGAIAALLLAGTLVRTWGVLVDPLDLWADEAWWATLLETRRLDDLGFRPIGYMWICRQIVELGSPEVMLRLVSLIAGVGTLVFLWRSGALLYRSRTAVLFVLLLAAFHPKLIVFAKEFKPYSFEVFIVAGLSYWAVVCLKRGRVSLGFLSGALIALPFCYPVVFLYPGFAMAFAGERLSALRRWTPPARVVSAVVAICFLVLSHLYLFERLDAAQSRWYWGSKYDVFPIATGFLGGLAWYARKTWDLLSLPGALESVPPALRSLFAIALLGGVAALVAAKRYRELALLGAPLVVVAVMNALGYWPYGAFRTNLFLVPGLLLVGGLAIDWLAERSRLRVVSFAGVFLALVAAAMVSPRSYGEKSITHWAPSPQLTAVLDAIQSRRIADSGDWNDVILADWHSWRPIDYYLRRYPDLHGHARLVRGPLADVSSLENQVAREIQAAFRAEYPTRLWVVVTRIDRHGAIGSSRWVRDFGVDRREFPTRDRNYHPLLFELRVQPLTDR
jgi:hypothetical protein